MRITTYTRFVVLFVVVLAVAAEVPLVLNESQHPVFLGRYSARALLAIVGVALAAAVVSAVALKWPKVAQGLSLSALSVLIAVVCIEGFARVVL